MFATSIVILAMTSRCASLVALTDTMWNKRQKGMAKEAVIQEINWTLDGRERLVALSLAWYVYDANEDGRAPKSLILMQVRRACESSEINALSDVPN